MEPHLKVFSVSQQANAKYKHNKHKSFKKRLVWCSVIWNTTFSIFASANHGNVYKINLKTGQCEFGLTPIAGHIFDFAFTPNKPSRIFSVSGTRHVSLWNSDSGP
eukprot:UN12180